ncbi:MAG TPA: bifunctional 3-deoxy-7-phosphoheptulonate synthase/chorismate mutase type II [Saprospiraceae bacterium]|nr:bifunctional 3-deoxy-7-phosphoheptulonate synthase/chorismate mutase type II [Saprospiraceae bacterium]HND87103.1 bifunctional 3-deoxy-7-phosphoheptulonate synthase/chorismate mutase type II [Saprospiraceae bacterium]
MLFQPIFPDFKRPVLIAGPCSAETEAQVLAVAHGLKGQQVDLFRAGIWKPRTRPGAFEGVGTPGLRWLSRVKEETGLRTTTEVANGHHVDECLQHGVDVVWIGARTTVNPFSVQEIADALAGTDMPVLLKNPVNPDYKLWVGALERLYRAGLRRIAAVHRGFSTYGDSKYRNVPRWQMPLDLMEEFPGLELICDISHICGRRDILAETAQKAYDLNFDGLMVEVHPSPDQAWSDASQQITPQQFADMNRSLLRRRLTSDDPDYQLGIEACRQQIDELDEEIIALIAQRMHMVRQIGYLKKDRNIAVYQPERWRALAEALRRRAEKNELGSEFVQMFLEAIHQEGINQQERIVNEGWEAALEQEARPASAAG